jgi:hypothetical protein
MMKNTIILFILILFVSSCATKKRCYDKWEMSPDTVTITNTKDSTVYSDTIVYVPIPGISQIDSVLIDIPCPPAPAGFIPDTAILKTDFAIAKAWYDNGMIKLSLEQKDKMLRLKLDRAIRESWHWRNEYKTITQVLKEKYVPKIYKQALVICIFIFAIAFGLMGWKLYKFIKK